MKPKPKKEFLTRRRWKHCVQALSCLVVFCTVYMLILPVITLEAKSYCGKEEHSHSPDCFIEIDQCGLIEHEHDEFCYDDEGSLVCPLDEHIHDDSCSDRILECGKTEHKHELICFSNPEADLDKPENWEKKIDEIKTDNPDFTKRQLITAIAKSQEGQKESLDNYKVQDETVKKGISRYGIWDDDPYEDWSGAFARFVLSYSGFEDELTAYPKDTDEWLEQLNKEEKLLPVLDGKQGDVLFTYTEQDELKAGIITDNNDDRITAIMGDWQDKVSRQTFQIDDSNLHSIFKITPDDPDKDQKDNEDENSSDDQFDKTDQASDPDQNKDQSSSSEDSNDNPAGPADFTESNGKFNSSFNDTSDEDTSKDDDNKTSQSSENCNDPDGKESDEKDVTDGLKDKSEDSSDFTGKEESDKSNKSDQTDDISSSEKDDSQNSSENSKTDADSENSSDDSSEDEKNGEEVDDPQTSEDENDASQSEDELKDQDSQENADEAETYTKEATAEDGTIIKASWPAGAFEDDSKIRLQVKAEELTKTQRKQIESHLDKDKSYSFKTYDIAFSSVNDEMELEKVEPQKPVTVNIEITENTYDLDSDSDDPMSIFHFKDDGKLEILDSHRLKDSQDKAAESKENVAPKKVKKVMQNQESDAENKTEVNNTSSDGNKNNRTVAYQFISDSFSSYTLPFLNSGNAVEIWNNDGYQKLVDYANGTFQLESNQYLKLMEDVYTPNNWSSGKIRISKAFRLDLNGFSLKNTKAEEPLFEIESGGDTLIFSSKALTETDMTGQITGAGWDLQTHTIYFNSSSSTQVSVQNPGVLQVQSGPEIVKAYSNASLRLENVALFGNGNGNALSIYNQATVNLENAYLVNNKRGIYISGGTLNVEDGWIANNETSDGGAGIKADIDQGASTTINLGTQVNPGTPNDKQAMIANNRVVNAPIRTHGGGIQLRGSTLNIRNATVQYNSISGTTWTCGGGIAALCQKYCPNDEWTGGMASQINLYSGALIDNNTAANGGGGIFLQGPRNGKLTYCNNPANHPNGITYPTTYENASKLFMYGGTVSNNIAEANEGGGIHQAAEYGSYAYLFAGEISNNETHTNAHWGGGGMFVGENSYLILPNGAGISNNEAQGLGGGIAACSTGNILFDENVVSALNKSHASAWTGEATAKPNDRLYAQGKDGFKNEGDARDFFSCLYATISALMPEGFEGANWTGVVDGNPVSKINTGTLTANQIMGLINEAPKALQDAALESRALRIVDNKSSIHGGGILVNGYMIGGDVEFQKTGPTVTFKADKQLLDKNGKNTNLGNNIFEFELYRKNTSGSSELIATGKNDSNGVITFQPPFVLDPELPQTVENGISISGVRTFVMKEKKNASSSFIMSDEEYEITIPYTTTFTYVMTYPVYDENGSKTKDVRVFKADTEIKDTVNINGIQIQRQVKRKSDGTIINHTYNQVGNDLPGSSMKNYTFYLDPGTEDFINQMIPNKSITVRKIWQDANGNVLEGTNIPDETIKFQLYRRKAGQEWESVPSGVIILPINKEGKKEWEYTFTELDGNYEYKVEETEGSLLYESSSSSSYYSDSNEYWVKADTIVPQHQYLIGSKNADNQIVLLDGAQGGKASVNRVNESETVNTSQIARTVQAEGRTWDDVFKYSPGNNVVFTAENLAFTSNNQGIALKSPSPVETYTRAEKYDNQSVVISGLMFSNAADLQKESGPISLDPATHSIKQSRASNSADIQEYQFDTLNNWFSSTTKISNGNPVFLYEKKQLTIVDQTNTVWTFTNKRKDKYQLNLTKQDGQTKVPLSDVKFELYTDENCSNKLRFTYDAGNHLYSADAAGNIEQLSTDDNGKISIKNLSLGTCYLKEVGAPEGYVPIEGVIQIEISQQADEADGKADMQITADPICNYEAYELPETGGSGTRWLTYGGLMLMAGSGLYLTRQARRRKAGG